MKLTDNMLLLLTVMFNIFKDVAVVGIFAYLSMHFNNIWIILIAALFIGGYNIKLNYKDKKEEEENNG